MSWQPDKTPRCNTDWHHPAADEVMAATDGLAAARALLEDKERALHEAAAALTEFHDRVASDEPVTRAERAAVNDRYRQADHDYQWEAAWVRTLDLASRGEGIGAHQTIGGAQ